MLGSLEEVRTPTVKYFLFNSSPHSLLILDRASVTLIVKRCVNETFIADDPAGGETWFASLRERTGR